MPSMEHFPNRSYSDHDNTEQYYDPQSVFGSSKGSIAASSISSSINDRASLCNNAEIELASPHYEDPVALRSEIRKGFRRKDNSLYESTGAQIKEERFAASSNTETRVEQSKKGCSNCNPPRVLVFVLLTISIVAFIVAVFNLLRTDTCSCARLEEQTAGNIQAVKSSETKELKEQIEELKANLSNLHLVLNSLLQEKANNDKKMNMMQVSLNDSKRQIFQLKDALNESKVQLKMLEVANNGIILNAKEIETVLNATSDQVVKTNKRVQVLGDNFTLTTQELRSSLMDKINLVNTQLNIQLNSTTTILESKDGQLENLLSSLNTSLNERITNVSKEEGPTGPVGKSGLPGINGTQGVPGKPGAGNLSLCEYDKKRAGSPVDLSHPKNTFVESYHKLDNNYVYTGLTCGCEKSAQTEFVYDKNAKVFKCQCSGNSIRGVTTGDKIYSTVHYWRCPRIS